MSVPIVPLLMFVSECCFSQEVFEEVSDPLVLGKLNIEPDYDISMRPLVDHNLSIPMNIEAELNLRNILLVNEIDQLITAEVTLRVFWNDSRLTLNSDHYDFCDRFGYYVLLHPNAINKLWTPDLFIDLSKDIRHPQVEIKPSSMLFYKEHFVRMDSRFNFDVACNMNFGSFPVDCQQCTINFESYSYTDTQWNLNWRKSGHEINTHIRLPEFEHRLIVNKEYLTDYYEENYTGMKALISLKRRILFFLVNVYMPSFLFVIIGLFALTIMDSPPARVGLGITTFLTLTTLFSSQKSYMPKISYFTLMDYWMMFSLMIMFLVNLEYPIYLLLRKNGYKRTARRLNVSTFIFVLSSIIAFNTVYWLIVGLETQKLCRGFDKNQTKFPEENKTEAEKMGCPDLAITSDEI